MRRRMISPSRSLAATVSLTLVSSVAVSGNASATTGTVASSPQSTHAKPPKVDPEYVYSVVDVEDPGAVRARAEKALGARFVDVWITPDQRSLVVGVIDLVPEEVEGLTQKVQRQAPVLFEERKVSREQVDMATAQVAEIADQPDSGIQAFGPDYEAGVALVEVKPEALPDVTAQLDSAPPVETTAEYAGSSVSSDVEPAPFEITVGEILPQAESATANPYRAGKKLSVGQTAANCTTGFLVKKGGANYGLTAGHCGKNGSKVYFAGTQRGNVQDNTLYAASPARSDASIFKMSKDGTATLYRSSTINRKVSEQFSKSKTVKGLRVCVRGSFTSDQSCGTVAAVGQTVDYGVGRKVQDLTRWTWTGKGTKGGDSGAPMYRVLQNGSATAVGINVAGNAVDTSYFVPITNALSGTGSTLAKS